MPRLHTTNSNEFVRPIINVTGKFPIDHKQLDTEQTQSIFKLVEESQEIDMTAILTLIEEQEREDELQNEAQL